MGTLYCLNCGHEFPEEGARRKPDRTGKWIFGTIGILAIAFGLLCFALALINGADSRMYFLGYGAMAVVAGLIALGLAAGLGKGMYFYCPQCNKGMSLPSQTKSAKLDKRKRGLS